MSGSDQPYDRTFLTTRAFYRDNILVADTIPDGGASTADNNSIPEIRMDVNPANRTEYPKIGSTNLPEGERLFTCGTAGRQYNGHLELFCWFTPGDGPCDPAGPSLIDGVLGSLDTRCHATIRVWAWGGEESVDPVTGPNGTLESEAGTVQSSSSQSANFGRWTLVHEQSIVVDTLIILRDIPADRYRVTVDFLTTDSEVDILEQHTQ